MSGVSGPRSTAATPVRRGVHAAPKRSRGRFGVGCYKHVAPSGAKTVRIVLENELDFAPEAKRLPSMTERCDFAPEERDVYSLNKKSESRSVRSDMSVAAHMRLLNGAGWFLVFGCYKHVAPSGGKTVRIVLENELDFAPEAKRLPSMTERCDFAPEERDVYSLNKKVNLAPLGATC